MEELLIAWRAAEDAAREAADLAEQRKQEIIAAMRQLDLKNYQSPLGKVAMVESTKCNIVVDRKEFEHTLKSKGMYERFCTTKFDLTAVKKYAEANDDDLYGMIELEKTASPRFTPNHNPGAVTEGAA